MHSLDKENSNTFQRKHQQRKYRQTVFRERSYSHLNMSDAGYSVDSQDVKSKIASFEAFNETVRNVDSPERRSNAGISPTSAASSGSRIMHRPVATASSDLVGRSHRDSTTTVASQSRKSRLQRAMSGKRQNQPEPGSLMQKRQSAKERRMASMQQNQDEKNDRQKEQRQPSSRHGSSRGQQTSPTKTLASPSSVASSRSRSSNHRMSTQSSASNVAPTYLSQSPNFKAATAAARQHRAQHYSKNYNAQQQQHHPSKQQQKPQQNFYAKGTPGADEDQVKTAKGGPLSRFHKLREKGRDHAHARIAQKRKQAAQMNGGATEQESDDMQGKHSLSSSHNRSSSQQQLSPARAMHPQHEQLIYQTQQNLAARSHDSPDHPNTTDDEATLTSVSRVLDQQQAFVQRDMAFEANRTQNATASYSSPSNASQAKRPPRLWIEGEEKSDKVNINQHSPQHHQHHHPQSRSMGAGIYPRPSSSSEFEPEVNPPRSPSQYAQYASLSKSGGITPSPQHQHQQRQSPRHQTQLLQEQAQPQYHYSPQYAHPGNSNYANNTPMSPSHHSPTQAGMIMPHQDRLRRSGGSYGNGGQQFYQSSSTTRLDDDDHTFDYGVKDDDSQGSTTFQQQLLEAERKAREQSHLSEGTAMSDHSHSVARRHGRLGRSSTPLLKTDDPLEPYRQHLESPVMKTAAGVIGAATVGCIVIGPVGMLLGAAAVGIGVGVMQIPEEQRSNMVKKASETMAKVEKQAVSASEVLGSSCATTYNNSGIADHIPLPPEMGKFCSVSEDDVDPVHAIAPNIKSEDSEAARLDQVTGPCGGGVGGDNLPMLKNQDSRKPASPNQSRSLRSKKVACLRHVNIRDVSEIHGLDPAAQPRAWLEVLASANTSNDEKTEAMEEILILAKDKQRARIFLEEGILDSIMWILSRYFEKINRKPTDNWANPHISPEERIAARLAATCCVTLGKAHCAAIHTEGDLLLMSLYERGTVPEERQLAQMLYEVPHHARVTKTDDPTIIDPSVEVFALKQLTLPQAEEIAKSVKELADRR